MSTQSSVHKAAGSVGGIAAHAPSRGGNDLQEYAPTATPAGAAPISASIISLNFIRSPSDPTRGAVCCRDTRTVFSGPQWKAGDTTVQPVLYLASQLQQIEVALDVSIVPHETTASTTHSVTLHLLNPDRYIFAGELSAEYSLTAGENSIVFTIPNPKIRDITTLISYICKLKFSYSCPGQSQTLMKEFFIEVYVLPTIPANPITLYEDNCKNLPNVDFIRIIQTPIQSYIADEDPFKDIMKRLYYNPYLKFAPENNDMQVFSTLLHELIPDDPSLRSLKTDVIQLSICNFFGAYFNTATHLKVDSEIYAILLMYGFCLLGKSAIVGHVIPLVTSDSDSALLITKEARGAGADGAITGFKLERQAVAQCGNLIYDASIRYLQEQGTEPLFALTFEKDEYNEQDGYVNRLFEEGTTAMLGGITNSIGVDDMICQITPAQYDNSSLATDQKSADPALVYNLQENKSAANAPKVEEEPPPVLDVKVLHPKAGANASVNVLYSVDSDPLKDHEYSYIYNNLPDVNDNLDIKLLFEGRILLDPTYEVIAVDVLGVHLALNMDNGGSVRYNMGDFSAGRLNWKVTNSSLTEQGSVEGETSVSWSFDECWNADLVVSSAKVNICNIAVRIPLIVRKANCDEQAAEPFRLPIFLTSEYAQIPTSPLISVLPQVRITVRPFPICADPFLKHVCMGSLNQGRCYSSSGVASLPNGCQAFYVAGGMSDKGITFTKGDASIDAFTIKADEGLINLGITAQLNSAKYRSTGKVIKDPAAVQYFVVAGGCYKWISYTNEIEVFRVEADATLTRIGGQTAALPAATDHASSAVITDGQAEYFVVAGGYNGSCLAVYSMDVGGILRKTDQNLAIEATGAAIGTISNANNRYLIVAGGVNTAGVQVYRILSGGLLAHESSFQLQTQRGDCASGVIKDANAKEYFIVAGGRGSYSYDPVFDEVDVFGFDENGVIRHIDCQQPRLSVARFDLSSGVLDQRFFIAAGGYTYDDGIVCSAVDMFSIGIDGILQRENADSLQMPAASAASGVITESSGTQNFVVAGGSGETGTTAAVEAFKIQNADSQRENYLAK